MRLIADAPAVNSKLQYIDSLRAIAILMVVMTHSDRFIVGLQSASIHFANFGQMGVQLFFIVSAFTLCLTFDNRKNEEKSLSKFYIRRFFRIAPLYYFGIFLYFIYFSIGEPLLLDKQPAIAAKYTLTNIMANLFLVNDFVTGPANNKIVPGGWSIGTETTFYALFPFIFLLYKKFTDRKWAVVLIPLAGIAVCFGLVLLAMQLTGRPMQNNSFLYFNIICQLPVFLFGMSLYFWLKNKPQVQSVTTTPYVIGFVLSLVLALATYILFKDFAFLLPIKAGICFVFLFMLFRHVPFLNNPLFVRIGQLSYSIYLFHFIFSWCGSKILNYYLQGIILPEFIFIINIIVATACSVGLATLSEKYIEKPGMALGKLMIDRLQTKKEKPVTAAAPQIIINRDVQRELGMN